MARRLELNTGAIARSQGLALDVFAPEAPMAGGCGALQHPDQQEVEGEHEDEAREEREEGGDVVCEQRLELILPHDERGRLDALPVLLHPRVDPRLAQRRLIYLFRSAPLPATTALFNK